MILKREQFIWDFYKRSQGIIPNSLSEVSYNRTTFKNPNASKEKLPLVCYMSLFPDFLEPKLIDPDNYNLKKIEHYGLAGVAMVISDSNSADDYLKVHTKRKLRSNLNRLMKQLEDEHTIKYEYNFGDISNEKCLELLTALHEMICKRFGNRTNDHVFMAEWDKNTQGLADSIRNKKSSLFVIYANGVPISISVNRHINQTILFSETHSFNIDFIKFGLGDIANYLVLQWAIRYNYSIIDLGNGILDNKRKWCNLIYDMEYLIFYRKKSIFAYLIAQIEAIKINLKNIVKSTKDRFQKK